jgi:hypothetical protein
MIFLQFHPLSSQASEWQLGLQAFTALNLSKMAPDVVSFNAAISSCEKGSNWQCLNLL